MDEVDGAVALVTIRTPLGDAAVIGELQFDSKTLYVRKAHVEASMRGLMGRRGINIILSKLAVEADVDKIVIEGAVRTTGKYKGKRPRAIVFPRRHQDRPQ